MHPKFVVIALLGTAPSIAVAQRAGPSLAFSTEDIYAVAWVDGELRAGSPTYAARFDPGAVEFTAALGETATRDYPLRVALRSVNRGQHQLLTAGSLGAPRPRLVDESVFYHHRGDIVERYDVRGDGVKQSVVFATRPAGSGDLVVRYSVATDLECAPTERAQELLFLASNLGGIAIGAVTGIDARGRIAQGHMAFDGQYLDLVLPHEFVETASYPLELDPLFGPELNVGVSFGDHLTDIAYDASSNIYGIAFEFPASGNPDVYVMRIDAATGNRLGGTNVGSGPGRQTHPGIASINQSDRFLVVWQDDGSGNDDIKCRGMDAATGALSQPVTIAGTAAAELAPDVGGDAFDNLDVEGLVVWQDAGIGILAVQVTLAPGLGDPVVLGSPVVLDPSPLSANPTISKSGGLDPANGGRYLVAWEATINSASFLGVIGVDRDLNLLTTSALVPGFFGATNPDIDGDGTQFLLVYEQLEGPAPATKDILCQPLEFCSGGTALCGGPGGPLANTAGDGEREPAVAFLGPMYAVAWSVANPGSTTEYRIAATNVVPGGCQLCGSLVLTGRNPGWHNSNPALCAKRSGGANSEEGLMSWETLELSSGNTLLRAHRYRPFTGGTVTPRPGVGGCGTGGTCDTNGPVALGNASFRLTLRGADPMASLAFAIADTTLAAPSSCGSCTVINPQAVLLTTVTNGDAEVPLPIPCSPLFLGFALDAQWLVLGPATANPPCALFPIASLSTAIRMVVAD